MDLVKTIKLKSDLIRFRDVNGCFRARVIYQMKGKKMMNKMVVVVLLWSRRCDGGGEVRVAARFRREGEMREMIY